MRRGARLAWATACAAAALAFFAQPAGAEDREWISDGGFETTTCPSDGYSCVSPHWTEVGSQAFLCKVGYCGLNPRDGAGWGVVGSDVIPPGQSVTGTLRQTDDHPRDVPATLVFALKIDNCCPFGVRSSFTADIRGDGAGECCLYEGDWQHLNSGWNNHVEVEVPPNRGDRLEFSTTCTSQTWADNPTPCPAWSVDDVSLRYHFPGPKTRITRKPDRKTKSRSARFEFKTRGGLIAFDCSLDGAGWKACVSPKRYRVGRGVHLFKVREARDPNSPAAAYRWTVRK